MTRGTTPYLVLAALGAGVVMTAMAAFTDPAAATFCSVFRHGPCAPTYCSPFAHRPCRPFYGFPLGENLQLTVVSKSREVSKEASKDAGTSKDSSTSQDDSKSNADNKARDDDKSQDDGKSQADADANPDRQGSDQSAPEVDTICSMFAVLRACWQPPPQDQEREGMQMSVRLSFTRDGKLKGEPRVTYVTPDAPPEAKQIYEQAIKATLDRCTPMPFSKGMGGAIAGKPIAIRFIDNRTAKPSEEHP